MKIKIRSLFSKIFPNNKNENIGTTLQLLNGTPATFTDFDGQIYNMASVRMCIDAIARNAAKLNPKHIRSTTEKFENLNNSLSRIISEQPNELMNAYDFYYKVISQLYLHNNAFIYILRDDNDNPIGLYPLTAGFYELKEYKEKIYVKFHFGSGNYTYAGLDDLIHLKRMYCENEIFGGSNIPIIKTLSFKHIMQEGIINAIKTTQGIKGIIKTSKSMLKPSDVKRIRDQFVKDFVNSGNESGIAGLDATMDFKEVNINPQTATDSQILNIDKEIQSYYGVSEEIIQSKYTEEQWNAFYESVLEPLGLMMGLEFTNKIFTYGQRFHGNKIVFEANRLQYASNATKISVAKEMHNYMTVNEIREMFNLAPIENGDKIMQDLNHIDSAIANDYQGGGDNDE